MTPLDALDLRLLELIQADSRMPQSELGERVHLSTAAVNRRLKRMRDEGVIQRYGAVLSPAALGHPLTIVAEVETESEQIELLDAMMQYQPSNRITARAALQHRYFADLDKTGMKF